LLPVALSDGFGGTFTEIENMDWKNTYPTTADVALASLETLCAWSDNLPTPQTDVQRTVLRRLNARRDELIAKQVREKAPHIADKFNAIIDRLSSLGIKSPIGRL